MSEWVILVHQFWARVGRRPQAPGSALDVPRRFMVVATFWMSLNLVLALLVSIPVINAVTHGTHATLAHAMGSTIGINSMILWAVGLAAIGEVSPGIGLVWEARLRALVPVIDLALLSFFLCLLAAGVLKGLSMTAWALPFHEAMDKARPLLQLMAISGAFLWLGICSLCVVWLRALRSCYR